MFKSCAFYKNKLDKDIVCFIRDLGHYKYLFHNVKTNEQQIYRIDFLVFPKYWEIIHDGWIGERYR